MTIHFVADVHVGNHRKFGGTIISGVNRRASETLEVLAEAVKISTGKGETLIVLGDLCDTPRPTPQLLNAIGGALTPIEGVSGPIILLVGNHDRISLSDNDHALAPFRWIEGVRVTESPTVISEDTTPIILVPHHPAPATEWLADTVRKLNPPKGGLLCVHLGIEDDDTPWFLKGAADSIHVDVLKALITEHELAGVFAGNWHDKRVWEGPNGEPIVQVGALVPTGFDNPGVEGYGNVAHWSPENGVTFTELEGPRFVTSKQVAHIEKLAQSSHKNLRVRYITSSPTLLEGEGQVEHLRDKFSELTVEVASQNIETAAMNAAEGVKQGKCFDEVLTEYIENMGVGELAPEVLTKVKGYLNESKTN